MSSPGSGRQSLSEAHARLGLELKRIRQGANKTTRDFSRTSGHISSVENGHTMPSKELIREYVNIGGDPSQLLFLYEAAHREGTAKRRQRAAVELVDSIDSTDRPNRVFAESYDVMHYIDARGVITEVSFVMAVRARQSNAPSLRIQQFYPFDQRRNVLSIESGIGCIVDSVKEAPVGAIDATIKFDRLLQPEDPAAHMITYRILVNSDKPAEPILVYEPSITMLRCTVGVQFAEPSIAENVRWFAAPSQMEARLSADPAKRFPHQASGYYAKVFTDLIVEWSYGLTWNPKS